MSVQEVIPGQPLFIPLLSADEYEHGNVRKDFKGYTVTIDPEAAEAIPKGARDNRKGLLYDKSWAGFDPVLWPHVLCAPASGFGFHRFELEGGGLLHVEYDACMPDWMVDISEEWLGNHVPCRMGDMSAGMMVGVGQHLRRTGCLGPFVLRGGGGGEACHLSADGTGWGAIW